MWLLKSLWSSVCVCVNVRICGMGSTWPTWDLGRSASSIWGRAWYWPVVSLCLQVCGFICMCISVDARQRLFIQVLPPGGGIFLTSVQFSSVQFSGSVVSDSLWPHELQHARPPCPSPTPGVHSNSCPLSRWCHPAISSCVVPFSPAPNPFQHQSLFQWVNSSHEVAKVLEFQP